MHREAKKPIQGNERNYKMVAHGFKTRQTELPNCCSEPKPHRGFPCGPSAGAQAFAEFHIPGPKAVTSKMEKKRNCSPCTGHEIK